MSQDIELPLLEKTKSKGRSSSHFPINMEGAQPRYRKITNFFKYLTYTDMLPLSRFINKEPRPIKHTDLPSPYESLNIDKRVNRLDKAWSEETQKAEESFGAKSPSLMKALARSHQDDLIRSLIILFFHANGSLMSSLLLGKIMGTITSGSLDGDIDMETLIMYTIGFAILAFGAVVTDNWYAYDGFRLGASFRLTVTGFLYKKLNSVALSSLQEISIGKVINLLTNDANEIDHAATYFSNTVLAPYNLLITFYMLWRYFGACSIITLTLQTAILISAGFLSNFSEKPKDEKNQCTDHRIKSANEFIENIRLIKLYAWEKPLMRMIEALRSSEVKALNKLANINAFSMMLTESSTYVCLLITSIIYMLTGGVLSPEKIYTSALVLSFSRYYINFCSHRGLMYYVSVRLICTRLEDVLKVNQIPQLNHTLKRNYLGSAEGSDNGEAGEAVNHNTIVFNNFTGYWNRNVNTSKPCLKNINLKIEEGELTTVIGKIGSGKTSFLMSFLKELPVTQGELSFSGSISYVEQEPIIFSGSIRENVLFGKEFDESYYLKAVRACNLHEDFKQFEFGDQTQVGERGTTLSGGQKARLSLARAFYSRSDIYLLDDPLSAVDSRVGKIIFEKGIKGLLKGKTVILVTHHLNYARDSDKVVVLEEGAVFAQGTFVSLLSKKVDLLKIFEEEHQEAETKKEIKSPNIRSLSGRRSSGRFSELQLPKMAGANEGKDALSPEQEALTEDECNLATKKTYFAYLKASQNYLLAFATLGCFLMANLFILGFTKFIGIWAQIQTESAYQGDEGEIVEVNNAKYVLICTAFTLGIIAFTFGKVAFTLKFLFGTNSNLHRNMLHKLSRTFVAFFDSTPIGNMLNRFSNDMGVLDNDNWYVVYDVFDQSIAVILFMSYLIFIFPAIIIPCLVILYALFKVKVFFTKPTVELRRVDLVSKSPIYSEISSTLNGLLAIRVYDQGRRFIDQFMDLIFVSAKAYQAYIRNNRLFSICLQILLYFLIVSLITMFIVIASGSQMEVGLFGLIVYYLVIVINDAGWIIRQTIFLDINMQSAQRIQDYCEIPEEAAVEVPQVDSRLKKMSRTGNWPSSGQLSFNDVYLKYPNTENCVLNGLTFSASAGTKVGIIGRTGAGKSSIIQALFRIVEIEETLGSSIQIDGIDTRIVGLELLRGGLSILPQTPVILSGTIRKNLDPFDEIEDCQIWDALEKVNLKVYVKSLEKGIETDMSMSNSVFSAGQKQLICMARAMLRRSKIVVLDEATANVDFTTDSFIQEKINEIFKDCVVLTIAHRLSTIAHYDKVLVLDKGRMLEYDHPYKLLVKKEGDTRITNEDGEFTKMVQRNGERVAREIFNRAYSAFYGKEKEPKLLENILTSSSE